MATARRLVFLFSIFVFTTFRLLGCVTVPPATPTAATSEPVDEPTVTPPSSPVEVVATATTEESTTTIDDVAESPVTPSAIPGAGIEDEDDPAEPMATEMVATPIPAFSPTPGMRPEAQVRVPVEMATVDPETLDEASRSQLATDFHLVVASVFQDASADLPLDQKRIVLTVNAGSDGGVITIASESIALIEMDGHVYHPVLEHELTPYMLGAEVSPEEGFYGFIAFDVPAELESGTLVWCLEVDYPCENPLLATFP